MNEDDKDSWLAYTIILCAMAFLIVFYYSMEGVC